MGFLAGMFVGAGIIIIIAAININEIEQKSHMEGFNDGLRCKLEYCIRTINAEAEYCHELARENYESHMLIEGYKLDAKAEAFDACVAILEKTSERDGEYDEMRI